MYFAKESSSWNNKAVSFINYNKSGYSYAKAYLITQEQFKEVQKQEGLSWYNMVIELDSIDGIPTLTFTNDEILKSKDLNFVDDMYLSVLRKGLKESFSELSDEDINNYFCKCGNRFW